MLRFNLSMKNVVQKLWQDEEGQDLVEYGLLIVLLGLAAITAMKGLASGISAAFKTASSSLTATS